MYQNYYFPYPGTIPPLNFAKSGGFRNFISRWALPAGLAALGGTAAYLWGSDPLHMEHVAGTLTGSLTTDKVGDYLIGTHDDLLKANSDLVPLKGILSDWKDSGNDINIPRYNGIVMKHAQRIADMNRDPSVSLFYDENLLDKIKSNVHLYKAPEIPVNEDLYNKWESGIKDNLGKYLKMKTFLDEHPRVVPGALSGAAAAASFGVGKLLTGGEADTSASRRRKAAGVPAYGFSRPGVRGSMLNPGWVYGTNFSFGSKLRTLIASALLAMSPAALAKTVEARDFTQFPQEVQEAVSVLSPQQQQNLLKQVCMAANYYGDGEKTGVRSELNEQLKKKDPGREKRPLARVFTQECVRQIGDAQTDSSPEYAKALSRANSQFVNDMIDQEQQDVPSKKRDDDTAGWINSLPEKLFPGQVVRDSAAVKAEKNRYTQDGSSGGYYSWESWGNPALSDRTSMNRSKIILPEDPHGGAHSAIHEMGHLKAFEDQDSATRKAEAKGFNLDELQATDFFDQVNKKLSFNDPAGENRKLLDQHLYGDSATLIDNFRDNPGQVSDPERMADFVKSMEQVQDKNAVYANDLVKQIESLGIDDGHIKPENRQLPAGKSSGARGAASILSSFVSRRPLASALGMNANTADLIYKQ